MRKLTHALLRLVVIGAAALFFVSHAPEAAMAAPTPAGTAISNTASATYTDANSVSYTTSSNTVTTTVQNAPALTETAGALTVTPGQGVTAVFTFTNSGNGTGAVVLAGATQIGPGTLGVGATNQASGSAYVYTGPGSGTTCTAAAPCTLLALNALISSVPEGTVFTVGVQYTVGGPATAVPGATIKTTLGGTITQNGAIVTQAATETDTVAADARMDLQKSAAVAGSGSGYITYTVNANNGGGFGATALYSAGSLLGLTGTAGVIPVMDQIPRYTNAVVQTTLVCPPAPTTPPTVPAGDSATVYYSTSANGLSNWSTTCSSTDNFIAVFVTTTNAGGVAFPSAPSGSTGAGAVTTPQVSFSFQITQPTGPGSTILGSLKNVANSIIGGNPGVNGTPIIAPGILPDTVYETGTTPQPATVFTTTTVNILPSSGTTPPGGASNVASAQAYAAQSVVNGPLDTAAATGSFNGLATLSNQNDFTDVGFTCANSATVPTAPGTPCTWPSTNVSIPNTFTNTGNDGDTFFIYAAAPAGYVVQLFSVTGCPATMPITTAAVLPIAPYGTGCVIGSAISPASLPGGVTVTTLGITVASTASYNYVAQYSPGVGAALAPFAALNFSTVVFGSGAIVTLGVPQLGADANQTYNTIYPGGPITVIKSTNITSNCSGTTTPANGVCPGGTIQYILNYANTAPAGLTPTGATEPLFALNGVNQNASGVTITDDGTVTGSWAASTFGIDAVVAPVIPSGVTPVYTPAVPLSTGTYPTKTQGPTKITVPLGAVPPGTSGTVKFQVTVQ